MTRNQKIALGCGGAGCLGLILLCVVGGLVYYFLYQSATTRRDEWLANVNRNYNINSNSNSTNDNANTNDNSDNSNSSSSADSTLSNDEKHRLFQAGNVTGDVEVIRRVNVKLGLMDEDFTPGEKYREFTAEHVSWAGKNYEFVLSINTPEKARAYVNEHLP